jgi:hypothetical protein
MSWKRRGKERLLTRIYVRFSWALSGSILPQPLAERIFAAQIKAFAASATAAQQHHDAS